MVAIALFTMLFATRFSGASSAEAPASPPGFVFSGIAASTTNDAQARLRPGAGLQTRQSVQALTTRHDLASVRASGGISPVASFSSGVSAAAISGEAGVGTKPLADIVDPKQPFVLWETRPNDTVSSIASLHGIEISTILDNNPEINDRNLLRAGQQIIVPRRDGILYKVSHGDTVSGIVDQFDNITVDAVLRFRPNGISEGSTLETGRYVLLPGATRKPPPPPVVVRPPGGGGGSPGVAPPRTSGRFALPLGGWRGISDEFGTSRGGGRIHEGMDFDLFGMSRSNIYSACNGVVSRTEFLTYSYGYHVIVDCGDSWTTLYAHLSYIGVSPGQRVVQGTILGQSGVTGFTTGEHLHFEIRYRGAPVDPAAYLL